MKPYFETETIRLYCGDCLDILPTLEKGGVDAVITDPPYGTTACAWDTIIPFEPMWAQLKRITKKNGAIVLFGSQPFTSALVMSNLEWFRYDIIWQKDQPTGGLNANRQPLRNHEAMLMFSSGQTTYNPQKFNFKNARFKLGEISRIGESKMNPEKDIYGDTGIETRTPWRETGKRYPLSVVYCSAKFRTAGNVHITAKLHPTQKPVDLMEYLIKTYTNEGETVLDFTMGSGTTGVAAIKLGRKFVGIELEERYCEIAKKRMIAELQKPRLIPITMLDAADDNPTQKPLLAI